MVAVNIPADGSAIWTFPCYSVTGDVGQGVLSGVNKQILWDMTNDVPSGFLGSLTARVVASDMGVMHTTQSPVRYWLMEFGNLDYSTPGLFEEVSKGDVLVFNG